MHVGIDFGREHLDVEVAEQRVVGVHQQPPAPSLADPAAAVRAALEKPLGFPALRRALTPDDHVVIVVDQLLPHLRELLAPLLEHIAQARVAIKAVTLLCSSADGSDKCWAELPSAFRDVHIQVHNPANRKQLSYLASTRRGRRLYLNRTAVDADQLIVLAACGYDPLLGYSGAEGALYPALGDEPTRQEMCGRLSLEAPKAKPWPVRQEAVEVAWLLGAPFMLQVVQGSGDDILHVIGGLADTVPEGQRLLDARWRLDVDQPADTVVASVGGNPDHHDFADLARALACAARVVKPEGRIVLLSQAKPTLGAGAETIRQAGNPGHALVLLRQQAPGDMAASFQWASAVQRASVYLLSGLPMATAEELFTTPLDHPGQVQRLLNDSGICLFVADAHKTLAVTRDTGRL